MNDTIRTEANTLRAVRLQCCTCLEKLLEKKRSDAYNELDAIVENDYLPGVEKQYRKTLR